VTAYGRKRTLNSVVFVVPGRPLSGKAAIKLILAKGAANDCGLNRSTQHFN